MSRVVRDDSSGVRSYQIEAGYRNAPAKKQETTPLYKDCYYLKMFTFQTAEIDGILLISISGFER